MLLNKAVEMAEAFFACHVIRNEFINQASWTGYGLAKQKMTAYAYDVILHIRKCVLLILT